MMGGLIPINEDEETLNRHKHPAYHLRLNKAVDRLLFIDIIRALDLMFDIGKQKYKYLGFGGPYLEDFKLLSSLFPDMELISLEPDKDTYKRQKFHQCSKNLNLMNCAFDEFLDETDLFDKGPFITWLDFTDNKIDRFREIEGMCKRVREKSLIRITVNADYERLPGFVKDDFERIYSEYLPERFSALDLVRHSGFGRLVCRMIERAIDKGLASAELSLLPLHRVRYRDGQQMVSFTGLIRESVADISIEKMEMVCPYISDEQEVSIIDLPTLTLKERLHLEKFLPNADSDGATIAKKLRYLIGKDAKDNLKKCAQYEKYYRFYPHFNKIIP